MTSKRKKEIADEARKRANLWLENVPFNKMTHDGSLLVFNMALGLVGCPFSPPPSWMNISDFSVFVSQKEYDSREYDEIIIDLFDEHYNRYYASGYFL